MSYAWFMSRSRTSSDAHAPVRRLLLAWYEANRRDLPWRESRDPYAIWVSEIMLQQTRVAVVIDRYRAFMARFPSLLELAAAPEEEVLALWSGLGYYRRARMLRRAAQLVAGGGAGLPATARELRQLPGVGAYTAAAIASIAHNEPVAAVDGNVERVIARLRGWEETDRSGAGDLRRRVESWARDLVDPARPGDFNQAMMELGATVCLPRGPHCLVCPLAAACATRGEHRTRPRAPMVSREVGCALVLRRRGGEAEYGEILLERRPESKTVMPGLWQLPVLRDAEVPEPELRLSVRHAIMQVNYRVRVRSVAEEVVEELTEPGGERRWVPPAEAAGMALTGLARKVLSRCRLLPVAAPEIPAVR